MGDLIKTGLLVIGLCAIEGCEVADIPGMFISTVPVDERFAQSMEWNDTHPIREIFVPTDEYHIMAMGDSHVGGTIHLDTFLARAVASQAKAVVMAGDLTTGHSEDYEVFQQHLPLHETLPSFLLPGNHDLYFEGWREFYSRFGSSIYYFTVRTPEASDLHICLDSGGGTLGTSQLDWFRDLLHHVRPDHRRCIVYTHNNLFRFRRTTSTNPNVEELKVLLVLFAENQVDMVITAHDHKQHSHHFGGTTHIVMDALKDGLTNAGYFELHIINGELTFKFCAVL